MEKLTRGFQRTQDFFRTRARFLFHQFVEPLSQDEDSRRHEFILNVLLLFSVVLSFACTSVVLFKLHTGESYTGVPFWSVSTIFLLFLGLYIASRLGHFKVSAYVLLFLYTIPLVYMTMVWGMDLPQALLLYALLITMSSILISTRFSLIFSGFIVLYLTVLAICFTMGIWVPDSSWRAQPFVTLDGVIFIFTFAVLSAVTWLSNREIDKSLERARHSEAALKEERDLLEVKVEERTAELRASQSAQLAQLHRFVEFGRLASGLFHDLANPLTAVALNLESLKVQPDDADQAKQHIEQALKATKGLEKFIGAARKQLQTQEMLSVFDVTKEIHEVVSVLSHKAKKAGVEIECRLPRSQMLFGNPLKFHQIIANLLSNAVDAYANKEDQKRTPVTITAAHEVDAVILTITDSGSGIPEEQQKHVFEPFFTTKGIESGMGIGLSSTKNIVEKDFHGTISFISIPGRGTSFAIRLPQSSSSATS